MAVSSLPVHLTGALAYEISGELGFGLGALGVAVAATRAVNAATSFVAGRMVDRRGSLSSIQIACVVAAASFAAMALFVRSYLSFVAVLAFAGLIQSICQPASNRLVGSAFPQERLGLAFGVKQSAGPIAGALSGLSVPLIALVLGWRWAFIVAAVVALVVLVASRRLQSTIGDDGSTEAVASRQRRRTLVDSKPAGRGSDDDSRDPSHETGRASRQRRLVWSLAAAFGFATAASSPLSAFFVDAAVRAGVAQGVAGSLLALGNLVSIAVRVLAGMACDRMSGEHLRLGSALVGAGSVGLLLLGTGRPTVMLFGLVLALGGVWGYNGVFWYAVIHSFPNRPGRITGVLAPSGLFGGVISPMLFGFVADAFDYSIAWNMCALFAVLAVGSMLVSVSLSRSIARD